MKAYKIPYHYAQTNEKQATAHIKLPRPTESDTITKLGQCLFMSQKSRLLLKIDVAKYYPSLNPQTAFKLLGYNHEKLNHSFPAGIPIGDSFYYRLSELVMNDIISPYKKHVVRHKDDILVKLRNEAEGKKIFANIISRLGQYELKINPHKSKIYNTRQEPVPYLGWLISPRSLKIAPESVEKFKLKLKTCSKRSKFRRIVFGFGHYYKFGTIRHQFREIDKSIRAIWRAKFIADNRPRKLHNLIGNKRVNQLCPSLVEINEEFEEYLYRTRKKKLLPFRHLKKCERQDFEIKRVKRDKQKQKYRRKADYFRTELASSLELQRRLFEGFKNIEAKLDKIEKDMRKLKKVVKKE